VQRAIEDFSKGGSAAAYNRAVRELADAEQADYRFLSGLARDNR
jgi:hypothetical protein